MSDRSTDFEDRLRGPSKAKGVEIRGPMAAGYAKILNPDASALLAELTNEDSTAIGQMRMMCGVFCNVCDTWRLPSWRKAEIRMLSRRKEVFELLHRIGEPR